MSLRPALSLWRRLPLWMEIMLVLLIKMVILILLWGAFFSKPQTKHMGLPPERLEQHLLTNTHSDISAGRGNGLTPIQPDLKGNHGTD